MSDALVGAIIGGILSLGGSFGALFVRDWLRGRGRITSAIKDCAIDIIRSDPNSTDRVSTLYSLEPLPEVDLKEVAELHVRAVLRLHNEKDVSVGLMEMHILLKEGRQQRLKCTPDARIRYMGLQEEQEQKPFQAATLPAQQVVIMSLQALFTEEAKIAQLATCDRANLRVRLSSGRVIEQKMFTESSFR
jgi:hypothetical protein